MKLIFKKNTHKGLLSLFVVLVTLVISLVIFGCDNPSSDNNPSTNKSSAKELTELTVTHNGVEYLVDVSSLTLTLPVIPPFGDTSATTSIATAASVSVTISPKATYIISSVDTKTISDDKIDLNNLSKITIKVTAEDGSKKEYTFTITIDTKEGGFFVKTYTNTDANTTSAIVAPIVAQGFVDGIMIDSTSVVTVFNLAATTEFNWKFKDVAGNALLSSTAAKTSNNKGEIDILKSDFTTLGINAIKALITSTTPEAILSLELSTTGTPPKTATQTVTYSPYKIFTWQDLQAVRNDLAGDYVLQQDIVFPDAGDGFPAKGFEPLGQTFGAEFRGNFDGKGYTISNFFIDSSDEDNVGLFGLVVTGQTGNQKIGKEIKNFTINHVGIKGKDNVGAVAGQVAGASNIESERNKITNVIVISDAEVSGMSLVGGLVGTSQYTTVIGYSAGDVSGITRVGGLVGRAHDEVIGYTTGDVSGNSNVGGLVGSAGVSNINNLYTIGVVYGYARGKITRNNATINIQFGLLVGGINDYTDSSTGTKYTPTVTGYHSGKTGESTFSGITSNDATGVDGTAVTVVATTAKTAFSKLTFGTDIGQWTWVADGKWPAINIGTTGLLKAPADQPIDP